MFASLSLPADLSLQVVDDFSLSLKYFSDCALDFCCFKIARNVRRRQWRRGQLVVLTTRTRSHGHSFVGVGRAHAVTWSLSMLGVGASRQ